MFKPVIKKTAVPLIRQYDTDKPYFIGGSVAIVGNSDLLTADRYGAEIDEHDVVFRFNLPLLKHDLDEYVGSKTTAVLMSQNITTHRYPHEEELQQRFEVFCRESDVICYPSHVKNVLQFNPQPYLLKIDVRKVNEVFSRHLPGNPYLFSNQHHPRNGIKLLACLDGVVPDLYGFDIHDRGDNRHYFDNEIQAETPARGHKPSVEFALLKGLAENGLVRIK